MPTERDLLDELETFRYLPTHPNLLQILALCHNCQINDGPGRMAIITEYQAHGSLDQFVEKFHHGKKTKTKIFFFR